MRSIARGLVIIAGCALLGACAGGGGGTIAAPGPAGAPGSAVSDYPVKVGEPYQVGGTTYTPVDVLNYDEVGYASFYGTDHAGRATANGESFRPGAFSAAHKTLPLPSYVEVTNIDTGKTILVRVNDRGPFANDRLIDLSEAAARALGFAERGYAPVRVRRVNPPEPDRLALREGRAASDRLDTPESLLVALRRKFGDRNAPSLGQAPAPPVQQQAPVATTVPPSQEGLRPGQSQQGRFVVENAGAAPSAATTPAPATSAATTPAPAASGDYVVQVGAYSARSRADAIASKIGARVEAGPGGVWRVRYGPYPSRDAAEEGLRRARSNGYGNARILSND